MGNIKLTRPGKSRVKVGCSSRNKLDSRNEFDNKDEVGDNKVSDNKVGDNEISKWKNHSKIFKSKKIISFIILSFFTPEVRLMFIKLKQIFVKALILYHFDLECHIWLR